MPRTLDPAGCLELRQWRLLRDAAVVTGDEQVTMYQCAEPLWHLDSDCDDLDGQRQAERTATVTELLAALDGTGVERTLCVCFSDLGYAAAIPETVTGQVIAAVGWLLRPQPDTDGSMHLAVGGLRAALGHVPEPGANPALDTQVAARAAALLTEHDTLADTDAYRAAVAGWWRTCGTDRAAPADDDSAPALLAEYHRLAADTVWLRTIPYSYIDLSGAAVDFDPTSPTLLRVPRRIFEFLDDHWFTRLLTSDGTMPRSAVAAALAVAGPGTEPLDDLVAALAAAERC